MATPFRVLAEYGRQMTATRSRIALRRLVAALLNTVEPDEIAQTARLITGHPSAQASYTALGMNVAAVWRAIEPIFQQPKAVLLPYVESAPDFGSGIQAIFAHFPKSPETCPPDASPLTVGDVYSALAQIVAMGGNGSRTDKELVLRELLCRANPGEAKYIVNNLTGEMPQGMRDDVLLEGVAMASAIDLELVRRCYMLLGDPGQVARLAITEGVAALERFELMLFTPLRPMLAQSVDDLTAAWVKDGGNLALEYKLEGARVQLHLQGGAVRIFTRHLMEITASLPELIDALRERVQADSAILEGEVVAVDAHGESLPFQELMRRFRRVRDVPRLLKEAPVKLYLFDLLYLNGASYLEAPNAQRWQLLQQTVRTDHLVALVPRQVPRTVEEGTAFFNRAIDQGHDGLIAKQLDSPYTPGMRSSGWLKVKEALTVDLVITATEWGYDRYGGWLSNYHLSARDVVTGELVMVAKTAKGQLDPEFKEWAQTLMELRTGPQSKVVTVRPELVVEVAFNQLQENPNYPGTLSLRFARILRFRPDKRLDDVDTLQTLRDLYAMQAAQSAEEAA